MDNILVSVLVPVYNTSQYLRKCLDTLVSQTLKEIEIICVNDGSTDDSLDILEEYAAKDPRVIIVTKPNGGLPSARNAGIENARGEYLGFVDSDDYVEPTMFEKLYKAAIKNNSEVVICGSEIFPEDPAPSQWLRDVLSPRTCHYPEFTPDVLFKERSRPFIWRNLIKRDLIMRENIRLKEDIVLGEDQALQFKVYPKARGISFISDKLYHYCWYRPGSIMNAETNKKFTKRVNAHANLCIHVMDEVKKNCAADMRKDILSWSVELIFDDFIKLAYSERSDIAKKLTEAWSDFGYWEFHNGFATHINDMFKYFYFIAGCPEPVRADLSIVVNLYNSKDYFPEFKKSVIGQTLDNVEIIFINNGSDNETYLHLHKWLISDYRVRVINQPYSSIASTFNQGLYLAEGEAVVFADAHDFLSSPSALSDHYKALFREGADVACAAYGGSKADLSDISLYDLVFRRAFLVDKELEFEDYHLLTTRDFAVKALSAADKVVDSNGSASLFRQRGIWRKDWLYTHEANNMLRGYCELLRTTAGAGMAREHVRVIDEVNSDSVVQTILNATNPYLMPVDSCPNGENSQSVTFGLLCELNRSIDPGLTGGAAGALKILSEFVNRRHAFLSNRMYL